MAKKEQPETRTAVDNINDTLSNVEQKVQKNQRPILFGLGAVIIVACAVIFGANYCSNKAKEAQEAIGAADIQLALGKDSLALAQYQAVANDYSGDAANRAQLNAAILLYKDGKYQEAIDCLDKYSPKEAVIGASAKSLEGDCYVNLKNYDEALKYFQEAVKISDDNPNLTPVFMLKMATVYREQKNYAQEAEVYQQIIDQYPNFGRSVNLDIEKYLERAKAQAGA